MQLTWTLRGFEELKKSCNIPRTWWTNYLHCRIDSSCTINYLDGWVEMQNGAYCTRMLYFREFVHFIRSLSLSFRWINYCFIYAIQKFYVNGTFLVKKSARIIKFLAFERTQRIFLFHLPLKKFELYIFRSYCLL